MRYITLILFILIMHVHLHAQPNKNVIHKIKNHIKDTISVNQVAKVDLFQETKKIYEWSNYKLYAPENIFHMCIWEDFNNDGLMDVFFRVRLYNKNNKNLEKTIFVMITFDGDTYESKGILDENMKRAVVYWTHYKNDLDIFEIRYNYDYKFRVTWDGREFIAGPYDEYE